MNFEFHNPTRLIFGAGKLSQLGEVAGRYGRKALIVTGGGSVKRSGVFDCAVAGLKAAGVALAECAGVEPNPRITSVRRGSRIARDEGCDVVIAQGGGSAMDAAKIIAAAILYDGDPWDMIEHALSAHHDITHGAGLAIVNPAYMRFVAKARPGRFVQFAERIFGLQAAEKDALGLAMEGIDKFEAFLRNIGCPTRLSELGIDDTLFSRYAEDAVLVVHDENGNLPGRPPLIRENIVEVLRSAL